MIKIVGNEHRNFPQLIEIHERLVNSTIMELEAQGFEIHACEPAMMQTGNQILYMATEVCYGVKEMEEREEKEY